MGLDMYLKKVKRLNRGMDILLQGKTFDEKDFFDITEKYHVVIDEEHNPDNVPEAIKKVATKIKVKQLMYKMDEIIKAFIPEINLDNIINIDCRKNKDKKEFLIWLKDQSSEPTKLIVSDSEIENMTEMVEKDAYVFDREDAFYWRKANQIREWFVNNLKEPVDNCQISSVSKDELDKLIKDCMKVLENRENAKDIIPTSEGFFFGGTEYDEYYFQDIIDTLYGMIKLMESTDWDNEGLYYTEWW